MKYLLTLALSLALMAPLCSCGTAVSARSSDLSFEQSAFFPEEEPEVQPEPEYVVYPVFVDQTFTNGDTLLRLPNSKKNQVDFTFTVIDFDGSELFSSGPVAPGEAAEWDVTERWHGRTHTLIITAASILDDGTEGNVSTQSILITIDLS